MNWVLCINNDGYQASLEPRKLYEQINDPVAQMVGMVRVIDESGESYLYSHELFIEMPMTVNDTLNAKLQAC